MTIFNQTTRRGFLLASVALGVVSLPGLKLNAAEPASGGTATLLISSEPPVLTTIAHTAYNPSIYRPRLPRVC